jgi:hypothetical protein
MSTSLKSRPKLIFHLPEPGAEKNDRHICPINDDLAWTLNWTTPPKQPLYQEVSPHDA